MLGCAHRPRSLAFAHESISLSQVAPAIVEAVMRDMMHRLGLVKPTQRADHTVHACGSLLAIWHANSGHGMGSSLDQRIEEQVDVYAFLFHELGVEFK